MSAGTDFIPTVDCIPRRYRYASPIRLRPAVSVSVISRERNGLSAKSGLTRALENSSTSVRVGKKYIVFRPLRQACRLRRIAQVVPPTWAAFVTTTCWAVSSYRSLRYSWPLKEKARPSRRIFLSAHSASGSVRDLVCGLASSSVRLAR